MNPVLKAGDLIYVPSKIYLWTFNEGEGPQTDAGLATRLEKPVQVLLLENEEVENNWLKIWHEGKEVYLERSDATPYQEERW